MFITIKKKTISIGIIIAVLAVSGYLNYRTQITNETVNVVSQSNKDNKTGEAIMVSGHVNTIIEAKNNREIVRSKACELLTKTMKETTATSDARQKAENALLEMAEAMDKENECESILKSKGFGDCVVFVSDSSVNVTIAKKDISAADAAKINDVVYTVTKINNIKIIGVV